MLEEAQPSLIGNSAASKDVFLEDGWSQVFGNG
jgi:hypothetical protein